MEISILLAEQILAMFLTMAVGSIFMTFLLGLAGGIHNTMYFAVPGLLVFLLMAKAMPDYIRVNKEHEVQQNTWCYECRRPGLKGRS